MKNRFLAFVFLPFLLSTAASAAALAEYEELTLKADAEILSSWKRAWERKSSADFAKLFTARARAPRWAAALERRREAGGISEYSWKSAPSSEVDRSALARQASAYLGRFDRIEAVDFRILELTRPAGPAGLELKVYLDLRALMPDGSRRTDRGELALNVDPAPTGWKLRSVDVESMETLTAKRPSFEDATGKSGLADVPVVPRAEAIRRGGYALAVADYDGDMQADLYVGGSGAGQLFHNDGNGAYRDVTAQAGLGKDTLVKAALMADMTGSGRTDLVLQRFVDDGGSELVFYENVGGGKFKQVAGNVVRKKKHDRAMSITAADFNGDGRLDLYVGYPGTKDFTDGRPRADGELTRQAVYINKGNWTFEEVDGDAAKPPFFSEITWPHSVVATDTNGDGKLDLVVVDDRGNSSRLYLNDGGGKFHSAESAAGLANRGWGMTAALGDFDGDGRDDIYFSNIDLTAGHRLLRLMDRDRLLDDKGVAAGLDETRFTRLVQGNRLYRALGDGTFREVTDKAGVGYAGEAPAGAVWFDYDNDGLLDLYVANGLWSADPSRDYASRFLLDELASPAKPLDPAGPDNPVMRLLQKTGDSFAGYQRNRLFRNNGDGTFTEVGYVTGADRIEDGYVAAAADYDRDGHTDLILRNADPAGLKWPSRPVTVLHNTGVSGSKSLAVYIKDGESIAFGTRVVLRAGGRTQTREIRATEGAVQREAMAFFGLGDAKPEFLEVRWPSGEIERFEDLKPGRIVIRKGKKEFETLTRR